MPDPFLSHLSVSGYESALDFKSPLSVVTPKIPDRPRAAHGGKLLKQLEQLESLAAELKEKRAALSLPDNLGMTIIIEVKPKNSLDFKTLEWKREGVEVLTVTDTADSNIVVLHVPDGKLSALELRIRDFLTIDRPQTGRPKNANLINAIESIGRAAFAELWTDETAPPLDDGEIFWCQLWLRQTLQNAADVVAQFIEVSGKLGLEIEQGYVKFPGRIVVAARGTRANFSSALELLDMVAEIREVTETAEFYLANLKPYEQVEWINELVSRTTPADAQSAPYVTLLDTGVNRVHPLLANHLDANDLHAVHPDWLVDDHHGHGTEMAGLALYGNLVSVLGSTDQIFLHHRIESVKILPPVGQNPPHLYGAVTTEATARVEITGPGRRRTYAMMTTCSANITGEPTEWSATIDQLAFGRPAIDIKYAEIEDEEVRNQRLFVLAAGNIHWQNWTNYSHVNSLSSVQNPSQSWNALTVGACTQLTYIDNKTYPSHAAIAASGDLSPCSTTSVTWKRSWPFKPDVVAEGGNGSIEHGLHVTVGPDSLRLVTTAKDLTTPLTESGDTSAAAAEVGRLCGQITSQNPTYWPETVRALIVHGARYTDAMMLLMPREARRLQKESLLRTFGYGLVKSDNTQYSTAHRPTLITQHEFNPYRYENAAVKLGQMQLHDLPLPTETLTELGAASVGLRITLSYFVEPNPGRRGWTTKYRYQSFAFRFAVKAASETDEEFLARVNRLERDDDDEDAHPDPDGASWTFGPQTRSRGSLHSDIWTGNAASIASKSKIAVFPVGGWWKDWKEANQYLKTARYSLIVSLEIAEDIETDIYAPILAKIRTAIPIIT